MRRPYVIYDIATAPFWISFYMWKILFSFLSVYTCRKFRPPVTRDAGMTQGLNLQPQEVILLPKDIQGFIKE